MKLWDKGTKINDLIESFTVGKDREMDFFLQNSMSLAL